MFQAALHAIYNMHIIFLFIPHFSLVRMHVCLLEPNDMQISPKAPVLQTMAQNTWRPAK